MLLRIGHIAVHCLGATAAAPDLLGHCLSCLPVDVGHLRAGEALTAGKGMRAYVSSNKAAACVVSECNHFTLSRDNTTTFSRFVPHIQCLDGSAGCTAAHRGHPQRHKGASIVSLEGSSP